MILAAGLLVLVALGLFLWGVATGVTGLYWACVALCVIAAVLLFAARYRMGREEPRRSREAVGARTGDQRDDQQDDGALPAAGSTSVGAAPAARDVEREHRHSDGPAYAADPPGRAERTQRVEPPVETLGEPTRAAAGDPVAAVDQPADTRAGDLPGDPAPAAAPGAHAGTPAAVPDPPDGGEPPVEEVEVSDLLLVVDLHDAVFVLDEHPRYHLADCRHLVGGTAIPLPLGEARADGFTPCAVCAPDRHLAAVERARRAARETP